MAFLIGEPLTAEHPVMTIFQSYFERSDPLELQPADHPRAARRARVEARLHVVGEG